VLFPTERVPLHIFEPRYKELIGECLADGNEFGLVLEDADGRREVGTCAAVLEVLRVFEDGRLNILVEGRARFRIVDETDGRAFRTAEIEALEDEIDPASDEEAERAVRLFGQLVDVAEADEVDRPSSDSANLSFELGARIDMGSRLKQELLELRSERARLERLCELIEVATRGLALEKEVEKRAAGNGRVTPPPGIGQSGTTS
jgi:Lon protease-like protein